MLISGVYPLYISCTSEMSAKGARVAVVLVAGLLSEFAVYFPYNFSIISADPLAPFQAKGVPSRAVRGGSWTAGAAATGLGCLRSLLASIASRRLFHDKPRGWRSVSEYINTSVASRVRLVWVSMAAHCCSIASCFSGSNCWLSR
jgi:hypothetical protein